MEGLGVTSLPGTSVKVGPSVSSIEATDTHRPKRAWIKVPGVHAELTVWLRLEWLPMCDAPADATPDRSERLVAPHVFGGVLGVTDHANCSNLVVRPQGAIATAD